MFVCPLLYRCVANHRFFSCSVSRWLPLGWGEGLASLRLRRVALSAGRNREEIVGFVGWAGRVVDLWNCRARRAALEHWVKCGRRRGIEDILKGEKRARQLTEMRVEDNNDTRALESYAPRSGRDTIAPAAAPSHCWFMISEIFN